VLLATPYLLTTPLSACTGRWCARWFREQVKAVIDFAARGADTLMLDR
jgi:hypothetical protein